ncbi:hypothetical protein [Streptomyces longispororuber]|uniref:hypothetical protein n=1 Tax=Streptomyces longispororuber TaxID=68230 RepID=UPI0036F5B551
MTRRLPRTRCPDCGRRAIVTITGQLRAHGQPRCPRRTLGRVWETRHRGRRVITLPGPDTWSPA